MSKQWILVGIVVAGLVAGGAFLAKSGSRIDQVAVGSRAPNFRAIDLATSDSVAFRERYRGSVTLVNIWATWCIPCRVEMPAMERVYRISHRGDSRSPP
jgi:thiol-disulfide isomerase/thioredoxin